MAASLDSMQEKPVTDEHGIAKLLPPVPDLVLVSLAVAGAATPVWLATRKKAA